MTHARRKSPSTVDPKPFKSISRRELALDPFDVVRRARYATDEVCVGFSCGKDSAVVLDLCAQWFDRVSAFYMYVTPGLSFHEQYMDYWEARLGKKLWGGKVHRVPHWALSRRLRDAALRSDLLDSRNVPEIRLKDTEVHASRLTGMHWFAYGIRKSDSLERRAMLSQCDSVHLVAQRFWPLAEWSNRAVAQYLRNREIPLSPEYTHMGRSYGGGLKADELIPIRDHFPEDFARIVARFPFVEAEIARYEFGLKEGKDTTRRQV